MPALVVDRDQRSHRAAPSEHARDDLRQQPVLDGVDPLLERLARLDRHCLLPEDRTGVEALVDEVDRHAGRLDARRERVVDRVRARGTPAAARGGR